MWLIMNLGFFNIARNPDDSGNGTLTVRSPVRSDLEALAKQCLPSMGEIVRHAGTDSPYQTTVPQADVAIALLNAALDIDYGDFSNSGTSAQGTERASLYLEVWDALDRLGAKASAELKPVRVAVVTDASPEDTASMTSPEPVSYGGVVVDDHYRVLLRKPRGEPDDCAWTFVDGGKRNGSSAEEATVLRVREQTGFQAEILAPIPGSYQWRTCTIEYFLMRPKGRACRVDSEETEQVRWATLDEARGLVRKTRDRVARERDCTVLEAAVAVRAAKQHVA